MGRANSHRSSRGRSRRRRELLFPHRDSCRLQPRIKPSDRGKVCFFEVGTEDNQSVFVDVISGDPDLVDYVGIRFHPSRETHNVYGRRPVTLSDGSKVYRFFLKRSEVQDFCRNVSIKVVGRGGSKRYRGLSVKPNKKFRGRSLKLLELRATRPNFHPFPESVTFGVEIEMSLDGFTTRTEVVNGILQHTGITVVDNTDSYRNGKKNHSSWKLVPDSSILCSRENPNCNKFELVSRVLFGEEGLTECQRVLAAIKQVGTISLNSSMGLHVHIGVGNLDLEDLKNVCLNFVKYEDEINTFMPPSRKDERLAGRYCKSNKNVILPFLGNGAKHKAIVDCKTLEDLCDLVNPPDDQNERRYYKLNLENLRIQRINTIEFRQHSCTGSFTKLAAWVRFCARLVANSDHRPKALKEGDDPFELLFDTVIRDIKLKDFYRNRKRELAEKPSPEDLVSDTYGRDKFEAPNGSEPACCGGCREGHSCERAPEPRTVRAFSGFAYAIEI